jgi:hypothetical protein
VPGHRLDNVLGLAGLEQAATNLWRRSWNRKAGRPAAVRSARQVVSHWRAGFVGSILWCWLAHHECVGSVWPSSSTRFNILDRVSSCLVERDASLARLVLAVADVEHASAGRALDVPHFSQADVPAPHVLSDFSEWRPVFSELFTTKGLRRSAKQRQTGTLTD